MPKPVEASSLDDVAPLLHTDLFVQVVVGDDFRPPNVYNFAQ